MVGVLPAVSGYNRIEQYKIPDEKCKGMVFGFLEGAAAGAVFTVFASGSSLMLGTMGAIISLVKSVITPIFLNEMGMLTVPREVLRNASAFALGGYIFTVVVEGATFGLPLIGVLAVAGAVYGFCSCFFKGMLDGTRATTLTSAAIEYLFPE